MCEAKRSFLMLDFVGNSEHFNEGYVPPKEEPLDPELGRSHRGRGGTLVPTVVATDSWIWLEWFDVAPGWEALGLEDLVGEANAMGLIMVHPTYENAGDGAPRKNLLPTEKSIPVQPIEFEAINCPLQWSSSTRIERDAWTLQSRFRLNLQRYICSGAF